MRPLKTETAGLPAGTQYDVFEAGVYEVRRLRWVGPDRQTRSVRVDGKGQLAEITAGGAIYDHHVATLGCNPEEEIPCGFCGDLIPACLTLCPECGHDPDADVSCEECWGSGTVTLSTTRSGLETYDATCPACHGEGTVEAPCAGMREDALAKARAWQKAQSAEANPVPAGIGGGR